MGIRIINLSEMSEDTVIAAGHRTPPKKKTKAPRKSPKKGPKKRKKKQPQKRKAKR